MRKAIFTLLVCASLDARLAVAQVAKPPTPDKTSNLLSTAKLYLEVGDYTAAEKQIVETLAITQAESKVGKDAEVLLREVLAKTKAKKQADIEITRQRQGALLREASRLSSEGKFDAASALIQKVLNEPGDPQLVKEAEESLAKAHPSWIGLLNNMRQHGYLVAGWALDLLLGFLAVVVAPVVLLRLLRRLWAWWQGNKWVVFGITDSTGLGVGELVIASLPRWRSELLEWRPPSAGLLKLEAPQLPSIPNFDLSQQEVDLASTLESLRFQIGSVDLGAIGKAMPAIRGWMNATRPWIRGTAVVSGSQVVVRLTRRNISGNLKTVNGLCQMAQGVDAGAVAAETASFKMYYLIAKEATIKEVTVSETEAAEKLRTGLSQLRGYISDGKPDALKAAGETFRSVRNEWPAFDEAHLYEGIVLDLMEHHDEAIQHFQYLAQHGSTDEFRKKGIYNEAISRFRKYRYDELEKAIAILGDLVGQHPDLRDLISSPIKALALATKANAIAHRPLFWQRLLFDGPKALEESRILERKGVVREQVRDWIHEVETITANLEIVYQNVERDDKVWGDLARRQLKWAIHNACGNVYLNYAVNFLGPPPLPYLQELEPELRKRYLEKAFFAFQECEMLLPAGVETLTNLATVLLNLSKTADARYYAQRAIDLNPDYEYAYFRLAQCWKEENRQDKVVEVLRSFTKTPRIPEFHELYHTYYVKPAES